MVLNAIKKAFLVKEQRNWSTVFFAIDVHDTILVADYNNTTLTFFPYAKEALQLISQRSDIINILFTCSYPEEIERYLKFFKENNIFFKYVNENLDVPSTALGNFDKKFYTNVYFDDKAGFNAKKEWKKIYEYFRDGDIGLKNFKEKAFEKHHNKYDYSKVIYKNALKKVIIICPEHGEFEQKPNTHISGGAGCPTCGGKEKLTKAIFTLRAKKIHKNKYDYSKVDYKSGKEKVIIICPIHGEFQQTPSSHINNKQGCPICGVNKSRSTHLYDNDLFIKLANEIHHNLYDYSKVNYKHSKEKVIIICKKHGEFKQIPNSHLNGNGCPICGMNNLSETKLYNYLKYSLPNFLIERQKSFDWLNSKTTSPQSIDIFLPQYNIGIEYQGKQHFKPVSKFGGDVGFNLVKERDERKRLLCRLNDVQLFYFSYDTSYVPNDYPYTIYSDERKLLREIENIIIKMNL